MLEVYSSHKDAAVKNEINFRFILDGNLYKSVSFVVPPDFWVTDDVAAAVAIAIRPVASNRIKFNFPISNRAKKIALRDYSIDLIALDGPESPVREDGINVLNFSGGVDSLAAHRLLGNKVKKISIDFGGRFSREANWFQKWDTFTVKTNLRDKPFSEHVDWRFMAAAALLHSDYLNISGIYWGTVLEASPFWFTTEQKTDFSKLRLNSVFDIAQLNIAQSVTPLREALIN